MSHNIKVLYVEDEADIRQELLEILALDYNDILVACNGQEALELYEKHHPDLIISDIQMPKMDGLTMCKKIKEQDSELPIILITAFNEIGYLNEAKSLGISHFISKPIDINILYASIESCLNENKKAQE